MEADVMAMPLAEGAVAPEDAPRFALPVFEGPLDLLLYLIQKNEVDIYDIPVAKITEQYTLYLDRMRELNLQVAADFILMAATLIHIKSRMLLPRSPQEAGPDAALEDPRQPLVEKLLEYQRFKEISRLLEEREAVSSAQYERPPAEASADAVALDVDVYDLMAALQEVLKRASDRKERLVYAQEISLTSRMNLILERLAEHGSLLFAELFDSSSSRLEIIVTFLGLLELVKQRAVLLFQEQPFGPIRVVMV
ncbi:MAG: segregation/condensation protein A [Acidobacteria bacterium]|nr:segregation/condensation protein A [Acidobacteriota bacterium]